MLSFFWDLPLKLAHGNFLPKAPLKLGVIFCQAPGISYQKRLLKRLYQPSCFLCGEEGASSMRSLAAHRKTTLWAFPCTPYIVTLTPNALKAPTGHYGHQLPKEGKKKSPLLVHNQGTWQKITPTGYSFKGVKSFLCQAQAWSCALHMHDCTLHPYPLTPIMPLRGIRG